MNKKHIVILSLMLIFKALLFGKVALTDREITLLDDVESRARLEDMILTLNLPLIGELDLQHYFDPQDHSLNFVNKKNLDFDLSPIPIKFEQIRIVENMGDLELKAKAKIFGRNSTVSLGHLKRATEIKIIESSNAKKLFLDISEMTLIFDFERSNIRLLNDLNLEFDSVSLVLRKNKPHQFLVKHIILGQPVDFDFTFLAEGTTLIKYFISNDILLSQLFPSGELDFNIVLKSLMLTNEYKSSSLFSQNLDFKLHGNAFADVQLFNEKLPIDLIDLPAMLQYTDNRYSIDIKLPELDLPVLGTISAGYLKLSDSFPLQLIGHGYLDLPKIGKHKYVLDAIYKDGKILLRGKFEHPIKYNNFTIESPKFIYSAATDSIKIFGKSSFQDIKCLLDLTFKNVNSFNQIEPELNVNILEKRLKPFADSTDLNLSNIELTSPHILAINENGKNEFIITGRTRFLGDDVNARISFAQSAKGIIPVLKVVPSQGWKISDSFEHIKKFDDLMFAEPQFIISDTAFYDPKREIYFNKGINFKGKLLLNKMVKPISDLVGLTEGDIMVTGSISDDLNNFIWHAPLATGLANKSKLLNIGPMHLELNSNTPLSIVSRISVHPTEKEILDFTGNFKLDGNKLILDSVYPGIWNNVFSIPGVNMDNPKLHVTLDYDNLNLNSMPDNIILEGNIILGNNRMYAKSIMNSDFSKFSLVGQWDHFWLNELADIVISNKHTYSILPPLEIKKISFNISPDNGLQLNGILGIFGLDINVDCSVNNLALKINGTLPKMIEPGIEILGQDHKNDPKLLIELTDGKNNSKILGTTKLGDIIEIHDPITITDQGCFLDSNTTIGRQKFGVKVTGKSLGFIKMPQFNLDFTFKNDSITYFKNIIRNELSITDQNLKKEVTTVISDIKILERNADSIQDPEQTDILLWSLDENKRKVNRWLERGLVKVNKNGIYSYHGLTNRFDLIDIKFNGPADKIMGSKIPLTFNISVLGEKHELKFVIDFANLDQSLIELGKEISRFAY